MDKTPLHGPYDVERWGKTNLAYKHTACTAAPGGPSLQWLRLKGLTKDCNARTGTKWNKRRRKPDIRNIVCLPYLLPGIHRAEQPLHTKQTQNKQRCSPCLCTTYTGVIIDCSALHRASNFNFFRVRFCVDGRGAAAGLGLVEDRHDFETESTTRKMQVGRKGKELKGRNCEKVPSPFVFVLMVEAQQQVWVWWKTDTTSRRSRPQEKCKSERRETNWKVEIAKRSRAPHGVRYVHLAPSAQRR